MPIRKTWRRGDHLVLDAESGKVIYGSEAGVNWDGSIRHRSMVETRQPQEFVRSKNDPAPLHEISGDTPSAPPSNIIPLTIGETNIKTKPGPGRNVFGLGVLGGDPGIGEMTIDAGATEGPFMVR